jgi:hypothetical protein
MAQIHADRIAPASRDSSRSEPTRLRGAGFLFGALLMGEDSLASAGGR